ncbi:CHASE2 domain-containing protein [Deinococcus sp. NW-56]|uniref:CHASE2 domain-containing protein n=1 Tax=Deinococcus sp. NW-56 TaxID=2080419 RepID=UPI000CF55964|nr:CHASE2 domain-containing protein [Deinococcus sp. NW-56]
MKHSIPPEPVTRRSWLQLLSPSRDLALFMVLFTVLLWSGSCQCLGPVSALVTRAPDRMFDLVSRVTYEWPAPAPVPGLPLVVLVAIDDAAVQRFSPNSYVFDRGTLSTLLQRIGVGQPRAVLLDLDLRFGSNAAPAGQRTGQRSGGDERLLTQLRAPRAYPILVIHNGLLGRQDLAEPGAGAHLCAVSPHLLEDDLVVRRLPRPRGAPSAAEALASIQAGQRDCTSGAVDSQVDDREARPWEVTSGLGRHIAFHRSWPHLFTQIPAGQLLTGPPQRRLELRDALVLVGRTDADSQDLHRTAASSSPMPGVLIHANAVLTRLTYPGGLQSLNFWPTVGLVSLGVGLALWCAHLTASSLLRLSRRPWFRQQVLPAAEFVLATALLVLLAAALLHFTGLFLDLTLPFVVLKLAQWLRGQFAPKGDSDAAPDPGPDPAHDPTP